MSYSNIFSRTFSSLVGLGMVICTLISAVGCTEGLEETKVKDRTTVSLKLDQAFQEKAYVRLNHDGTQDDYWFYALTQDFKRRSAGSAGRDRRHDPYSCDLRKWKKEEGLRKFCRLFFTARVYDILRKRKGRRVCDDTEKCNRD